ncbi:Type III PLP / low-specificity D-threonine aldolase [hydrothermal vent metagenome]|uniref:Type III PLP / low-specificity D-threonine aldolase n=1 Tax=hydrothermal vent metagenome TaxID=652676 RepID=A0A3B0VUJ6_9ZZZZ
MHEQTFWYEPKRPNEIASPALLIFPERVKQNIEHLIAIAGDVGRLRPHVKTHKLPQIVTLHQTYGIDKMKCATIAEAEMVARCGVADILLAYQPVGPNQQRLIQLAQTYPDSQFGCLLDNETTLRQLGAQLVGHDVTLNVWIDIDNGNGRSGIQSGKTAENLAKLISDTPQLRFAGLHVYDGHFAHLSIEGRIDKANAAFAPVYEMVQQLAADDVIVPNIVAGGSPTFPVHARQTNLDLSPGTYTLWDMGYAALCPELPFVHAAVLLSRVISKPLPNRLCLDLGHKAVAAENPLENRVRFLNALEATFISQNEEHLVIELPNAADFAVGDVLYGVPWHICPTVALHQEAIAIGEDGVVNGRWPIIARNRRLEI